MAHYFRIPLVEDFDTKELVFIKDVKTGSKRNLVCFHCSGEMIPVNREENKPKPYFRHKNVECGVNLETFIHWLSKKVFDELESIKLPKIDFEFLYKSYWENNESFEVKLNDLFSKHSIDIGFKNLRSFNIVLQEIIDFKFKSTREEKLIGSDYEKIRPDIILYSGDEEYLVEPYYSNPIDQEKLLKIIKLDINTISINLNNFLHENDFLYSKEQFKNFIQNDVDSKNWSFISDKDRCQLLSLFMLKLEQYIVENLTKVKEYNRIVQLRDSLPKKKDPFAEKIQVLREERTEIKGHLNKIDLQMSNNNDQILIIDEAIDKLKLELESIKYCFFDNS